MIFWYLSENAPSRRTLRLLFFISEQRSTQLHFLGRLRRLLGGSSKVYTHQQAVVSDIVTLKPPCIRVQLLQ